MRDTEAMNQLPKAASLAGLQGGYQIVRRFLSKFIEL